ncbi:MAG TPA: hypothetical protein VFM19_05605 [Candidatus Limnocylindria bacterium]|nr:hypothetical protein [Candidatus Limnocylindria bacterium]
MTVAHYRPRRRRGLAGLFGSIDDFMNWLLYGHETWLVALIKGVPLFLLVYFLLTYIPNYAYYLVTQYLLKFSDDVGFLVAQGVGGGNFILLIILALWTQAARGRSGFAWALVRFIDFTQLLFTLLLLIPLLLFNLGGGTFVPNPGQNPFPLQALLLGAIGAGIGAAALVYLWLEYRRVAERDAADAAAPAAYLPG